jgi:hypothetical protein
MLQQRLLPTAFLLLAGLAAAPTAQAAPFAIATAQAGTSESGNEDHEEQEGSGAAASASYFVDFVGSSNSYSTLTGDHIQVRADATAGPLASEPNVIATTSRATASWTDDFSVTVPDSFEGTPKIHLVFQFDGSLSGESTFHLSIFDQSLGALAESSYGTLFGSDIDDFDLIPDGQTGPHTVNDILDYYTLLSAEGPVTLQFSLEVSAAADESNGFSAVDFSQNSLRLTSLAIEDELGNLIEGATLASGSGFSYPLANVPEPSTALLASLGVMGLGAFGRRRRV